jgi:hypothetical protein
LGRPLKQILSLKISTQKNYRNPIWQHHWQHFADFAKENPGTKVGAFDVELQKAFKSVEACR